MFSESPELYDIIYGSFKDYAAEAEAVARLLADHAPEAERILDVGCGTGEHARHLHAAHGYHVDGLDIEPGFVELARSKLPDATFSHGDMADFALQTRYDVVLCLFSAIGYVGDEARLHSTLTAFRSHLRPGGVAIVEPWFEPGAWTHGRVFTHVGESAETSVVRMSHSGVRGNRSILEFHYLVGTSNGVEHRTETHELTLFTRREMMDACEAGGFDSVRHDPVGLTGRGLYICGVT